MRHKYLIFTLSALAVATSISISTISGKDLLRTSAYDVSGLTKDIDLNDSSESEVRNYYSNLNSLSDSEKSGTNLLKNLKPILKEGQKYYSYDSGDSIWKMYEIIDRDWDKSPASSIAGYNASSNIITGYTYGSSASNPGSNPYLHALYVDRNVQNHMHAWALEGSGKTSHGGNGEWCIDREHIWPKAEGFEDSGKGGARGDPMHLWAGDSGVNSALHSNYYYGYVDRNANPTIGYKWSYTSKNLMGKSKTLGGTVTVFEPQDSDKGDIARAVFYMAARYNFIDKNDTLSSDNPNLALTNSLSDWSATGYMSTINVPGKMGILSDLLEWNRLDPPDEWEIHRNNLLFKNYTNNRNPFIDFPSWADYVWGNEHIAANPQSDIINAFEEDTTPRVISVTLDKSELNLDLKKNTTATLNVTVTTKYGADSSVTWTSSDESVASVDQNGKVTAHKEGTAVITATSNFDSSKRASCKVTVSKGLNLLLIGLFAGAALVVFVILYIVFKGFRKKVNKTAKKQVKKSVKSSSKKSSGSSKKR